MKVAGAREIRANYADFVGSTEPVVVTRHGKVSGVYLPLEDQESIPGDLREELARVLGAHLSTLLKLQGVEEEEVLEDFREFRKRRRS